MLLKKAWHKAKNGIINFNNIKVKIKTDKNIKVKSWWFLSIFIFWYTYTISYKVKVQNSGTVVMWIDSIEETKNNDNIEYVLEGIGTKEFINPGEEKEFILGVRSDLSNVQIKQA